MEIWVYSCCYVALTCCCWSVATWKWVTNIALVANANRNMISDTAVCIDTTKSWAWVLTFSVHTCFVRWTFWVDYTFWSAIWRWTNHFRKTSTVTSASKVPRWVGIWSTRVGVTWVFHNNWFNCWNYMHWKNWLNIWWTSFINLAVFGAYFFQDAIYLTTFLHTGLNLCMRVRMFTIFSLIVKLVFNWKL